MCGERGGYRVTSSDHMKWLWKTENYDPGSNTDVEEDEDYAPLPKLHPINDNEITKNPSPDTRIENLDEESKRD